MDFSKFLYTEEDSEAAPIPLALGERERAAVIPSLTRKRPRPSTKACDEPAGDAIGVQELYATPGTVEKQLKLLIIGHNPSAQSWAKGHYYANPSNRMWPLLAKAGIVPAHFTAADDQQCPSLCGLGFTDIMPGVCETDSSKFPDAAVAACKASLYQRLVAHCERVGGEHSAPRVIAFAGLRQWRALFPATHSKPRTAAEEDRYGVQTERPPDWPAELAASAVFLLPSSSGAAAMTTEQRQAPYLALGQLCKDLDLAASAEL